jgi:hypothetical protein
VQLTGLLGHPRNESGLPAGLEHQLSKHGSQLAWEQHPILPGKVPEGDGAWDNSGMIGGKRHDQRIVPDPESRETSIAFRESEETEIQVTLEQRLPLRFSMQLDQGDLDVRKPLPEGAENGREPEPGGQIDVSDPQNSGFTFAGSSRGPHRLVGRLQDATRLDQKDPARFRQGDPPLGPAEQQKSQLLLEVFDLLAQGGLRYPNPGCGLPEVELLGDGDEVPEVAQFHILIWNSY